MRAQRAASNWRLGKSLGPPGLLQSQRELQATQLFTSGQEGGRRRAGGGGQEEEGRRRRGLSIEVGEAGAVLLLYT